MGNERVRKIPLSPEESRAVVLSWYAPGSVPKEELERDYHTSTLNSFRKIRQLVQNYPELSLLLGDPDFEDEGKYTQEKVELLKEVLTHSSFEEGKKAVDAYIDLALGFWQYGFSECVFNFSVNNGVTQDGRMVLVDFGEITLDKEKVADRIGSERWLKAYSFKTLSSELQVYFKQEMHDRFTVKTLENTWGRKKK